MIEAEIAFVGVGSVGETLLKALLRVNAVASERVRVSHPREERREELQDRYSVSVFAKNTKAVQGARVVVFCVKPQILLRVVEEVSAYVGDDTVMISIAAGVPIAAMERKLRRAARFVRVMPNTPTLVGAGASVLAAGPNADEEDLRMAKEIFASVGETVVVEEDLIDAATGLSGSGPAYVFLVIEALADGGVKMGLSRDRSMRLAAQTVYGAAKLLIETGEHPGRLKDQVTSPGGTAIAGIHTLETGGLRTTLINAVEAAAIRAKELGSSFMATED